MHDQNISKELYCKKSRLENLLNTIKIKKKKLNDELQNKDNETISEEIISLSQDLDKLIVEYIKIRDEIKSKE